MRPIQLGLTGSIGMGKSTVANHFRALGFPVFDADQAVHDLYRKGGTAVESIRELFPDAIVDDAVSRPKLTEKVLADPSALKAVEKLVHPLVASERARFLETAVSRGLLAVVYDIPLLLENRNNYDIDFVIVVTASPATQEKRVLKRPGMTMEKFQSILSKQMPDEEKRKYADYLVFTDYPSVTQAKAQVARIVESILESRPQVWETWKNRYPTLPNISPSDIPTLSAGSILSHYFEAVVFDLDDTLVEVWPPIHRATQRMLEFMDTAMPKTVTLLRDNIKSAAERVKEEQPLISHDLGAVRREAIRLYARGIPGEEEKIEGVVDERSKVEEHVFADAIGCLAYLSEVPNMKLCLLTNGNCDLKHSPNLLKYFQLCLQSAEVGAAKPSPIPFIAAAQKLGIVPRRILYIGDSYEHDVIGARAAGVCVAWLKRSSDNTEDVGADNRIEPDIILRSLDIPHIESQLRDWSLRLQNVQA